MNYGIELNRILDKCNLTEEERIEFETFLDGKVYQDIAFFPNFEKSLTEMIKANSLLDIAQKKIHSCGQWNDIMKLILPLYWSQKLKEPK